MAKHEPEEVDLLEILAAFYASLRRNYILSILLPVLGVVIAIVVVKRAGSTYESSLLIETSLLTENESKFLFDQLDKLGIIPGLTADEDKLVAKFKFKVMQNPRNPEKTLNEPSLYLQVTASVLDKSVFPSLEKAIVGFVNTSQPVVRHRAERTKFYDELIKKIDQEIGAMNDIKKEINSSVQATYLDPSQLYVETIELFRERMRLQVRRDEVETVHLIKGFDELLIDKKASTILAGLIGFFIGFTLLCLILFLKFFAAYFKRYKSTHPVE